MSINLLNDCSTSEADSDPFARPGSLDPESYKAYTRNLVCQMGIQEFVSIEDVISDSIAQVTCSSIGLENPTAFVRNLINNHCKLIASEHPRISITVVKSVSISNPKEERVVKDNFNSLLEKAICSDRGLINRASLEIACHPKNRVTCWQNYYRGRQTFIN